MEVIILAGGKGTRLQSVVSDVPKPMAPIKDEPFLAYILKWVSKYQVSKIVISIGYKAADIRNYFQDSYNGIPIVYAHEQKPLGTGGGIRFAASFTSDPNLLIINGDTWFPVPLNQMLKFHIEKKASLTMALKEMKDFDRYGTVILEEDKVVGFSEKKYNEKGLINGGIYVLNTDKINLENYSEVFSFEQEILEKGISGQTYLAVVFDELFIDIGVPEDYKKACEVL